VKEEHERERSCEPAQDVERSLPATLMRVATAVAVDALWRHDWQRLAHGEGRIPMALTSLMARAAASCLLLMVLVVGASPVPAEARPGFKRCRAPSDISRLDIGPRQRPCAAARSVARAWKRKASCDPSNRAARNCTLRLSRPWGCQAQADGYDPDSPVPYYVVCTRDFWHPMSGEPITAMVTFYW
jgi:hypothetical protein